MPIRFLPSEELRKFGSKKTIKKLVTQKLTLNRAVLKTLANSDLIPKKNLEKVALKAIKTYKKVYGEERQDGESVAASLENALNEKKLLVNRVQNAVVFEIGSELKETYKGEFYIWLPSSANEPDPLHQLNYGQKFQIGVGEAPGDRFGCQCGMEILTEQDLEDEQENDNVTKGKK